MKTILALLVTLLAMPAWGDAGEDWGKTRGWGYSGATEPYDCDATVLGHLWYDTSDEVDELLVCRDVTPIEVGSAPPDVYEWSSANKNFIFDVRDFGAVCTFKSGDTTATLNDDGPAINQAISAAVPDGQISHSGNIVLIPGQCYTEEPIVWKASVQLQGIGRQRSGIWCAPGMNDNCVTAGPGSTHTSTVMRRLQIGKASPCVEAGLMGGPSQFKSGVTCTKTTSTDTRGSGLIYLVDTADGKNIEEVWFTGFPEYGMWVNQGTDGFWADDLVFFSNGHFAGETESNVANVSGTSTTLTDSGKSWTPDEWKGWFVRITEAGELRTRLVTTNTATTLTFADLTALDAFSIVTSSTTYKIDRGGGFIIESDQILGGSSPEELVGCQVNNVTGDGNQPALLQLYGGLHTNGGGCTFRNLDNEGSATAPYTVDIIIPNNMWVFDGISHRGAGSGAAIYMEGGSYPQSISYRAVTIKESASPGYIDASGVDPTLARFTNLKRTLEGNFYFGANFGGWNTGPIWAGPKADPPYSCIDYYQGHTYWDSTHGPCTCDGSVDLWCEIGNVGCDTSTDCDSGT